MTLTEAGELRLRERIDQLTDERDAAVAKVELLHSALARCLSSHNRALEDAARLSHQLEEKKRELKALREQRADAPAGEAKDLKRKLARAREAIARAHKSRDVWRGRALDAEAMLAATRAGRAVKGRKKASTSGREMAAVPTTGKDTA